MPRARTEKKMGFMWRLPNNKARITKIFKEQRNKNVQIIPISFLPITSSGLRISWHDLSLGPFHKLRKT